MTPNDNASQLGLKLSLFEDIAEVVRTQEQQLDQLNLKFCGKILMLQCADISLHVVHCF